MAKSNLAWVKFHIINFVHNRDLDVERDERIKGFSDDCATVDQMREYQYLKWQRPDSGVTKADVDNMILHLMQTGQFKLKGNGGVTLGKVVFEQNLEGVPVTPKAENLAKSLLKDLDDRRGSGSETWGDDVRDELVNSWAAMIDKEFGNAPPVVATVAPTQTQLPASVPAQT